MLVRDVMTASVVTLRPEDKFTQIVKLLSRRKISGAPVVNSKGKIIGVVSEKDLFYKLFPSTKTFYKEPEFYMNFDNIDKEAVRVKRLKAKNLMTRKPVFVSPDDHILKACSYFLKYKIRRLPVVEKGKLIGIVSTNDVYKNYLSFLIKR